MEQNKARDMPKPVPFIIFYAFCERYSSMGVAGMNLTNFDTTYYRSG